MPEATAGRGASAGGCGSRPSLGNQGLAGSVLLPPRGQGLSPVCFGVCGTHPVPLGDKHCQAVSKVGTALRICKTPGKAPNVCSLRSSPATTSLGGGRPPELSRRHPGGPQKAKSPPEGPQWRRRVAGVVLGLSPLSPHPWWQGWEKSPGCGDTTSDISWPAPGAGKSLPCPHAKSCMGSRSSAQPPEQTTAAVTLRKHSGQGGDECQPSWWSCPAPRAEPHQHPHAFPRCPERCEAGARLSPPPKWAPHMPRPPGYGDAHLCGAVPDPAILPLR